MVPTMMIPDTIIMEEPKEDCITRKNLGSLRLNRKAAVVTLVHTLKCLVVQNAYCILRRMLDRCLIQRRFNVNHRPCVECHFRSTPPTSFPRLLERVSTQRTAQLSHAIKASR
jgi:hypothetical protein